MDDVSVFIQRIIVASKTLIQQAKSFESVHKKKKSLERQGYLPQRTERGKKNCATIKLLLSYVIFVSVRNDCTKAIKTRTKVSLSIEYQRQGWQ